MPSVYTSFTNYGSWGQSRTFKRRGVSIDVTPHADGDTIDQLMFIAWEIEPNATWEDLDNFRKDLINTFVNQPRLKFINYSESFPMLIEVDKLYYPRTGHGRKIPRVAKVVDIAKNYVVLRAVSLDLNGFVCFESPICHVRSKAEFEHQYHVGNGVEKATAECTVPPEQRVDREYSLPNKHVVARYTQLSEALALAYKWGGDDTRDSIAQSIRSFTPDPVVTPNKG